MLWKGVPLSLSQLKALGLPALGRFSSEEKKALQEVSGEDFETLRKLSRFLFETTQPSSFCDNSGNFPCHLLAELLSLQGKRVVVLDTRFRVEESLGLLQYLKREIFELPIRKMGSYDFLESGGATRYGTECLGGPVFGEVLDKLKGSYDLLLVQSDAPVDSTEAVVLAQQVDALVAVLQRRPKKSCAFYAMGVCADAAGLSSVATEVEGISHTRLQTSSLAECGIAIV